MIAQAVERTICAGHIPPLPGKGVRVELRKANTQSSMNEFETQLPIATDLGHIQSNHPVFELLDLVCRLVTGLHQTVRR